MGSISGTDARASSALSSLRAATLGSLTKSSTTCSAAAPPIATRIRTAGRRSSTFRFAGAGRAENERASEQPVRGLPMVDGPVMEMAAQPLDERFGDRAARPVGEDFDERGKLLLKFLGEELFVRARQMLARPELGADR